MKVLPLLVAALWSALAPASSVFAQERSSETRELLDDLGLPAPAVEEEPAEEAEAEADAAPSRADLVPLLQAAGGFTPMFVEKNVAVKMRTGAILRADVFRPQDPGKHPAIITLGPYPKDIPFADWNPEAWAKLGDDGDYMHWETVDPQWWVPQGYVVIRVDARGTGASQAAGPPNVLSKAEAEDFFDAIGWAAGQRWSNGKVAVMGVSYFAMNAWQVAALQPPALAAVVVWEGAQDLYGDAARHGGIYSNTFLERWNASTARHATGGSLPPFPAASSELLTADVKAGNPDLSAIEVPLLSAGNWGGVGLHLRGNVYGWEGAASREKMLRLHIGDHVTPFYSIEGRMMQKRFLDRWLLDLPTGIDREPPIKLAIRLGGDRYLWRYEYEWPLQRTRWTPYYLDAAGPSLRSTAAAAATTSYSADPTRGRGSAVFTSAPFDRRTEVTGPVKVKLWISSSSDDADLFVIVRNLDPEGSEVTYPGSNQPKLAAAYGWLRASHRKLDPERSRPYRPVHTHDELQKLEPGQIVPVEVEVLPTSFVLAPGHRLVVEVGANDDPRIFPFTHTDPNDRITSGDVSIHTGGRHDSHILLPIVRGR